ncbi:MULTISPECIES: Ltp family lipoprotein [Bacillaceae]|uniref:Ltp family lipoprotein n=1 Tax=Bacillaceae TaxID=186817 RepID=UPI002964B285|nr:Ltp family lipoprotein [Bacillus infantis]MDW2879702.1 Ltp family lipoprotein [Bacillus infantis]
MKETAFEEERLMLQLDKVRGDDEVNTSKYSMVDVMDALKKIKKNWDKLNDMQKKNLIDKIISKIEINFINGRLKSKPRKKLRQKLKPMSKAGIYDQLTSEYGENFPQEAA